MTAPGSVNLRVALLTREFPPEVYGGAGVHVEHLARELARLLDLEVHCFGAPRSSPLVAGAYEPWAALAGDEPRSKVLEYLSTDLAMAAGLSDPDLVHSHTWYVNLAGHLAGLLHDVPHIVTVHSLEPLRPWKAEQLGGGYAVSSFCERTALEAAASVIAVSHGMRDDLLGAYPAVAADRVEVIPNGIDPDEFKPDSGTDTLEALGIDPRRPSVVFVGRVTRQKGLTHLLDAAERFDGSAQLVLCAGAPDTPELEAEVRERVQRLRRRRHGVIWVEEMLSRPALAQVLTHATVFVCPSVYEPFGIVNLEAMACGAAVVATDTGGIPEVVVEGETGLLVPFEPAEAEIGPADPAAFASAMASRIDALLSDPDRAQRMGSAGRQRVLDHFSWASIAQRTAALYRSVLSSR